MDEEFDKLLSFLSSEERGKDRKLEEIFQQTMEFFERYKYVLKTGSPEEQSSMRSKMDILRAKLREQTERRQKEAGITQEEMLEITKDPKNFTPAQWEFIQRAQSSIKEQNQEVEAELKSRKETRMNELRSKSKKKSSSRKGDWMKS